MKTLLARIIRRFNESLSVASYGTTLGERIRLFVLLLVRPGEVFFPLRAHLRRNNVPFSFTFRSHSDLALFVELFCTHPYRIQMREPSYIMDLGANIGLSTLYLHTSYPQARIAAVEANPGIISRLHETVAGISKITILPYAVSASEGPHDFFIQEENSLGSSLRKRDEGRRRVVVEAHSLDTLRQQLGFPRIDLVKFDIEGAEYETFAAYPHREEIEALVGEVHEDLMDVDLDTFQVLWEGMRLRSTPTRKKRRYIIHGTRH